MDDDDDDNNNNNNVLSVPPLNVIAIADYNAESGTFLFCCCFFGFFGFWF
jgi:hypothetical protein